MYVLKTGGLVCICNPATYKRGDTEGQGAGLHRPWKKWGHVLVSKARQSMCDSFLSLWKLRTRSIYKYFI